MARINVSLQSGKMAGINVSLQLGKMAGINVYIVLLQKRNFMEYQQERPTHEKLQKEIFAFKTMKSIDKTAAFRKVLFRIRKEHIRRWRTVFIRSCAAALFVSLITGGIWLYITRYQNDMPIEIERITGNVVLQLPDGTELVFDENQSVTDLSDIDLLIAGNSAERETTGMDEFSAEELSAPVYSTLVVFRGNRHLMILKDGTQVWLNAESSLRFPNHFGGGERRVYLQGEAYFAVTENTKQPFVIETNEQIATVLGTELNIFAYSGVSRVDATSSGVSGVDAASSGVSGVDATSSGVSGVYTTLVTGSVSLASKSSDATIVLKPGEQAILKPGSEDYQLCKVNAAEVISWRTGKFVFDGNTLEEAFMKMSRWYDFEYLFEDSYVAGLELMGSIPIYGDLDSVLQFIKDLGMVRIERKGTNVTIRKEK